MRAALSQPNCPSQVRAKCCVKSAESKRRVTDVSKISAFLKLFLGLI